MSTHERLIIIGSGAAGLTAAIYAARANLHPLVITGMQAGGQLTITTDVENYPGFADIIQGPWLMQQMQTQAEKVGARMCYDLVTGLDSGVHPFRVHCDSGEVFTADAIILATGARARWLGLPSEAQFNGRGVSACATCDGFFYKGHEVIVVGGGNMAVEEALYLANICAHVTLVHRRDSLRAERILQDRLFAHPKISVKWHSEVAEILGDEKGVTGVLLRTVDGGTGAHLTAPLPAPLPVHGVFIAIGHDPATSAFSEAVVLDMEGYIEVQLGTTITSMPGIFAAGDCVDKTYRQAVTAAGMGCMAALDAERWLASRKPVTA